MTGIGDVDYEILIRVDRAALVVMSMTDRYTYKLCRARVWTARLVAEYGFRSQCVDRDRMLYFTMSGKSASSLARTAVDRDIHEILSHLIQRKVYLDYILVDDLCMCAIAKNNAPMLHLLLTSPWARGQVVSLARYLYESARRNHYECARLLVDEMTAQNIVTAEDIRCGITMAINVDNSRMFAMFVALDERARSSRRMAFYLAECARLSSHEILDWIAALGADVAPPCKEILPRTL